MDKPRRTSWQPASRWYDNLVGSSGHYYHERLVLPGALRLLGFERDPAPSVLDLACGQGVLGRRVPPQAEYVGLDAAPDLVRAARGRDRSPRHRYEVADVARPLTLAKRDFTHAACVLALQNVGRPGEVIANAARHLRPGGRLVLVLNHPCFRIPRQSGWGVDGASSLRYRRVSRYMSPMKIPLQLHPSQAKASPVAWTFHHPLSYYSRWLREAGFLIEGIEEWVSDKESRGPAARMEDRSRAEIPLFLALSARRQ